MLTVLTVLSVRHTMPSLLHCECSPLREDIQSSTMVVLSVPRPAAPTAFIWEGGIDRSRRHIRSGTSQLSRVGPSYLSAPMRQATSSGQPIFNPCRASTAWTNCEASSSPPLEPSPLTSSEAVRGRTATVKASTRSSVTNCSTVKLLHSARSQGDHRELETALQPRIRTPICLCD